MADRIGHPKIRYWSDTMTRRDYVLLSTAIREAIENPRCGWSHCDGVSEAAERIADALAAANPRFDRDRFIQDACG